MESLCGDSIAAPKKEDLCSVSNASDNRCLLDKWKVFVNNDYHFSYLTGIWTIRER
jgi:hypothetical protein